MTPFGASWRGAFIGQLPAGPRIPWGRLYRVACRVERSATWLKVYFWHKSIRA